MTCRGQSRFPQWIIVIGVLLMMFGISLDGISQDSYRRDELTTLGHVGALERSDNLITVGDTLTLVAEYSPEHAPLYYMTLNVWGLVHSYHYYPLRMISLFAGVIAVAGIYLLGKKMANHRTGLFASLLATTNIVFVFYTHELREWIWVVLCAVLILLIYWHIVSRKRSVRPMYFLALFIVTILALYTNYSIIFVLIAVGLYHLFFVRKDNVWMYTSIVVITAGILFLPWLPTVLFSLSNRSAQLGSTSSLLLSNPDLVKQLMRFWGNGQIIIFLILTVCGLFATRHNKKAGLTFIFFGIVILSGYLTLNEILPFIKRLRYVLVWFIPFSLFAGLGLAWLSRWKLALIALMGVWLISGYTFVTTNDFKSQMGLSPLEHFTEYQELIPLLQAHTEQNSALIEVVYDGSTLAKSKQGKQSIDKYYLSHTNVIVTYLMTYIPPLEASEYALGAITDLSDFWLTYQWDKITGGIAYFIAQAEADFIPCETYAYGQRSILIHYISRTDVDIDCIA